MTDHCGGCGLPLKPASPLGGRLRCCSDAYWSEAEPLPRDRIAYERMQGFGMRLQHILGNDVLEEPLFLFNSFGRQR